MEAKQAGLEDFLKKRDVQFVIPVYQRNYDWEKHHCEKLLNDIISVEKSDRLSHFIGSIVYIHEGVSLSTDLKKLIIIDGQQRITTMTILWLAILERAKEFGMERQEKRIKRNFIINEDHEGEEKLKLKSTSDNHAVLGGLIREGAKFDSVEVSNVIINFDVFYEKINRNNIEKIIRGISKLLFVEIGLERGKDEPQRIFESLNSTGLDLGQADLIRNYILIDLKSELQEKLYNNYWLPAEKYTRIEETNKNKTDDFIRDYLTLKTKHIPNKSKVYQEFKKTHTFDKSKTGLEDLLAEILQFAKHYGKLINPKKEPDAKIRHHIESINLLEVTVSYPFLLAVYQDYDSEVLSKEEFAAVLEIIQSYVFRRFIVNLRTADLNKIFETLYSEIDKDDYINSLMLALVKKQRSQRFPNNTELKKELEFRDIYNSKNQKRKYFFLRLETALHKEPISWDDYSIEHIFPQNPGQAWKRELDEAEFVEMKEKHLHTLSNLTLTKYNSKYSNRGFSEKRDMPDGFKESHLFLNKFVANCEKWNPLTLKKRYEILWEQFCKIWSYPDVIVPEKDASEEINIFDIHDPTGKKIEYYIFDRKKIFTNTYKQLLTDIVKIFFVSEPKAFNGTVLGEKLKLVKQAKDLQRFSEIGKEYYIYTWLRSRDVIGKIKLVLETFGWDELYIKFKEDLNEE